MTSIMVFWVLNFELKFSLSEKATKTCAICLMILKFKYLVNVITIRQILQIFVAFSEKLNCKKFKLIHLICFWVSLIIKELKYLNRSMTEKCDSTIQPFENSINSVQKAVDLTTSAKNRRKMRIINLNFQIKKLISLASRVAWNWPSKSTTQSLIFREM